MKSPLATKNFTWRNFKTLGEARLVRELEVGKTLTRSEFVALAAEITGPETKADPPQNERLPNTKTIPTYPNGLTRREVELLRLLTQGLSNPEIAQKLDLSRRTVEAHLRSIYNKLEVPSRTAAVRFAIEHNLSYPIKFAMPEKDLLNGYMVHPNEPCSQHG